MPPRVRARRAGYGGLENEAVAEILARKQGTFVPGAVHETFVDYTMTRDGDDEHMAVCSCGWHRMELRTKADADTAATMHVAIMDGWSDPRMWAVIQTQLDHTELLFMGPNGPRLGGIYCACGEVFSAYPVGHDTAARRFYLHVAEQTVQALQDLAST